APALTGADGGAVAVGLGLAGTVAAAGSRSQLMAPPPVSYSVAAPSRRRSARSRSRYGHARLDPRVLRYGLLSQLGNLWCVPIYECDGPRSCTGFDEIQR